MPVVCARIELRLPKGHPAGTRCYPGLAGKSGECAALREREQVKAVAPVVNRCRADREKYYGQLRE